MPRIGLRKFVNHALPIFLVLVCLTAISEQTLAQTGSRPANGENRNDEINLDTQLYDRWHESG